ncbi:MAG: DNA methyltransferase [Alphaproteobacteria bacterium]
MREADRSKLVAQGDGTAGFRLANHRLIVEVPLETLKRAPNQARTHNPAQIAKISNSIRRFGFVVPIVVDETGEIVAGHARYEAAKVLGLEMVPVLEQKFLNEAEKRAYRIADNRLAELADWDEEALKLDFECLLDFDIDPEITGFDTVDIDKIIFGEEEESDPADTIPGDPDRESDPIAQIGDVWVLGDHRILCSDARDPESYLRLLGDERAQMAITDPPYNVAIDGHVCGLGSIHHREFAMASGEMSAEEFRAFLHASCEAMAQCSCDGAIHFIYMDWRHIGDLLSVAEDVYSEIKNVVVWAKTNAGMGSFYRSQHELIVAAKVGKGRHVNTFGLGKKRHRSNVWTYPGVNTFRRGRDEDLEAHPTVKPTAMIADAIRDCSSAGGIILDPFLGSGTTILAAEKTGRRARGIEIDPAYVDVAISRWETMTGGQAVLDGTDISFERRMMEREEAQKALPAPDDSLRQDGEGTDDE